MCKGLCQGERAWLTGIAERVPVWPGPEHSCKTSTQGPNAAENGKTILWARGFLRGDGQGRVELDEDSSGSRAEVRRLLQLWGKTGYPAEL